MGQMKELYIEIENELDTIEKQLEDCKEWGTEVEVVYSALIAMKKNPRLTASEAMIEGLIEWG